MSSLYVSTVRRGLRRASCPLVAIFVLAGCAMEVDAGEAPEGDDPPEVAATAEAIQNGSSVFGRKGVISISSTFGGFCTGVMIGPYHALTAAHCTGLEGTGKSDSPQFKMTVEYFDPKRGRRIVAGDPVTGKPEGVGVAAIPTWDGLKKAGVIDFQDDLGIIFYWPGWRETTSADYVDLSTGSLVDQRASLFYGAGVTSSGFGSDELRSMLINLADVREYYFYDKGGSARICDGDSGGPYFNEFGVYGVHSTSERSTTRDRCAANGGKQYGARISSRIAWIDGWVSGQTGRHCVALSRYATRCF